MLDGIQVLDLSQGIAGPLSAIYLSDQGATVIKVEPPGVDPTRAWNGSPVWNRGKHSLTLNLPKPEGLEVLQRLGFDYETAHALNPRLIY